MASPFEPLAEWKLTEGYISSVMRGDGGDFMAKGSENAMVTGTGLTRAFKGPLLIGGGKLGSRVFFNTDQSYAGLGIGNVNGVGSVFKIKQLLAYIGSGQLNFNGAAIATVSASSTLSFLKKSGGVYAAGAGTGPFQAGHAQPSAPNIYPKDNPSAGKSAMSGAVVVYIWRICSFTGQPSLASLPSNVLVLSGQDVIVEFPAVDANGQDYWGIGVVKLGFEELGVGYTLPTSLGGVVAESALATIDGIARAVEISWSNGALFNSELIPDKAFPPVAGQFAGVMNDAVWLDADGIIYVGEPGFFGSFAPKSAVFAPEPAVLYLQAEDGVTLRFGATRVGALYYVGGSPAIEYQTIIENQGILLPQNAALGFGGRVLAWFGKPTVISSTSFEPDFDYAAKVIGEFAGWAEGQTTAKPIVPGYDGLGQFECWSWGKKVMARHGPTGKWCSPIDLTGKVTGDIMAAVTVNLPGIGHALYLSCNNGAALSLYQFDAGTGSVMKIQTSDVTRMNFGGDVTMIMTEGRVDNTANPVRVQLVKNYNNAAPLADPLEGLGAQTPTATGEQSFTLREPNAIDASRKHAVLVTMTSTGGDTGLNRVATFGSADEVARR